MAQPNAATATDAFGPLRVQILEFFFYLAPFHGWALASAYAPPSETLACWATVAAGAYLQALCGCYIPSSAFQWVGFGPLQPATTGAVTCSTISSMARSVSSSSFACVASAAAFAGLAITAQGAAGTLALAAFAAAFLLKHEPTSQVHSVAVRRLR